MEQFTRCTRCILPSTLSNIYFNEEGVCNHCLKYEKDFREWDSISERKEKEFIRILEKAKSLKRPYDCLVPLSGGKDSTYALYLASRIYKLKVLAITLDNGYLSNPAKENIKNALESCNADHIFYHINRNNTSELFKVFLEKTGDFCNACMRGINYAIEFSTKSFKIPLVIKGSGSRVQYVSMIKQSSSLNTAAYFSNVLRRTPVEEKFRHLSRNKYTMEFQKIFGGIADILGFQRTALLRFFPQHIGMYDYIYKPYPEIIEILKKEMKWSDGAGKAEHLDCELHDIPFYKDSLMIPNISNNTFYYSGLIRQGIINREEALKREMTELQNNRQPSDLDKYLEENNIALEDYKKYVVNSDNAGYAPKFQWMVRKVYRKLRKF